MISNKLLSKVLGKNCGNIHFLVRSNTIMYTIQNDVDMLIKNGIEINIYELAHKCKEWAYTKGFRLQAQKYKNMDYSCIIDEMNIEFHPAKYATTEPESVFKACEFILKEKVS